MSNPHSFLGFNAAATNEFRARIQAYQAVHAHERGCQTERYHTQKTLQRETVGAHVGFMIGAAFIIYDTPSLALMKAISFHDHMEAVTGDIPAPMKLRDPNLKIRLDELEMEFHAESKLPGWPKMDAFEDRQLKMLDRLSGVAFSAREMRMGNWEAQLSFLNYSNYIAALKPNWKELYFFEGLLDTEPSRNRMVPDSLKRLFDATIKMVRESSEPKYRTNPKPDGQTAS
jgi:5'-deoxynucleotidase YfbR-like HD superfamily hydrolase